MIKNYHFRIIIALLILIGLMTFIFGGSARADHPTPWKLTCYYPGGAFQRDITNWTLDDDAWFIWKGLRPEGKNVFGTADYIVKGEYCIISKYNKHPKLVKKVKKVHPKPEEKFEEPQGQFEEREKF